MRYAWTPKFQLSGPTVHSYTVDQPLTILVNFGHFFNFLKTVQKQRQTALESFSTTPYVILGLFKPFLCS